MAGNWVRFSACEQCMEFGAPRELIISPTFTQINAYGHTLSVSEHIFIMQLLLSHLFQ